MYYYLRGKVALHQKNSIVLEVNNIGYLIYVSKPEEFAIGEELLVYTEFYVREDEQFLVGFKTFEEKFLFSKLVSVKGVGPKTALSCMSSCKVEELIEAINNSNLLFLKSLNGVGQKAATQIILDLRGKLVIENSQTGDKELDDAIAGLKQFGFNRKEIMDAISKISKRGLKAEEYISLALKYINK